MRIYICTLLMMLSCLISISAIGQSVLPKSYEVPVVGNSFLVGKEEGDSKIGRKVVSISNRDKRSLKTYFKLLGTGTLEVQLLGRKVGETDAQFSTVFLGNKNHFILDKEENTTINLGTFKIKSPGYHHIDLLPLDGVTEITHLILSGSAVEGGIIYSNNPEYYYWARRGPSCHMNYDIPTKENVSYYYNEVTVPKGFDVNGSYYMANGFGEGYFGIQVNGPSERRVLFSVWSPFHTDDPKSIPEDQKIKMLKKGDNVQTGEFGNEGSGGQSFLRYNWKAGEKYKFLLKGVPDGLGNTDYTAWFMPAETGEWQLIASFKRPKTNTYLTRFHSFLENFNPAQGYLTRKVDFSNQWVYDGEWKKINSARLSVDATYSAHQRVDATGGKSKKGYFLKMGGFFDEIEKPGSSFTFDNSNSAPKIDFSKLP